MIYNLRTKKQERKAKRYGYDDELVDAAVVTLFATTDANSDGVISEAEFVSACEADRGIDCASAFAVCDTDHSHSVSLDELAVCMGWDVEGYGGYMGY